MSQLFKLIRRSLNAVYALAGAASAICIIAACLLIVAQIIARLLHSHIPSSMDFIRYFTIWGAFLGFGYAMHHHIHIRVSLFTSRLSPTLSRWLNVAVGSSAALLLCILTYYLYGLIRDSFEYEDVTDGEIVLPLGWIQLPMLIGMGIFVLSMLDYTIKEIVNPKLNQPSELIGDGS